MPHSTRTLDGSLRLLAMTLWIGTSATLGCSCFMKDQLSGTTNREEREAQGTQQEDFPEEFDRESGPDAQETEEEDAPDNSNEEEEPEPQDDSEGESEEEPEREAKQEQETENQEESPGGDSGAGGSRGSGQPTAPEEAARAASDLLHDAEALAEEGDTEAAYAKAIEALDLVYPHAKEDKKCDEIRRKAGKLTEELDDQLEQTPPDVDEPIKVR